MWNSESTIVIVGIQMALAAGFIALTVAARRHGGAAQSAAIDAVRDQGIDVEGEVLYRHGAQFTESRPAMILPLAIAAILLIAAALNFTTPDLARPVDGVLAGAVLVLVGPVTATQVFTRRFLVRRFRESDDARIRAVDVPDMLRAATRRYPRWTRAVQIARFVLATAGSILVLALVIVG